MKTLSTLLLVLALLPAMTLPTLALEEKPPMTEGETQAWLKIAALNVKVKALQDQIAKDKAAQEQREASDTAKALEILRRAQQDLTADSDLFAAALAERKTAQANADHPLHYAVRGASSLVPIAYILWMKSDLMISADKQKALEAENAALKQKLITAENEVLRVTSGLSEAQRTAEQNYQAALMAQQQAATAQAAAQASASRPPPAASGYTPIPTFKNQRPRAVISGDTMDNMHRAIMEAEARRQSDALERIQRQQSLDSARNIFKK